MSFAEHQIDLPNSFRQGHPLKECSRCGADKEPSGGVDLSPAVQPAIDFDDPKVQAVYSILCDTKMHGKPDEEHWEGWQARRIVEALAQPADPYAAVIGGELFYANEIDWSTLRNQEQEVVLLYKAPQPLTDGDERVHVICLCPDCVKAKAAPQPAEAQEPVAWMRKDGMKAMPADEKRAWVEAGQPEAAEDYTVPLYATPQPAKAKPIAWGMPNIKGEIFDCITPDEHARVEGDYTVPLYTAPQPVRQALTDAEIVEIYQRFGTGRLDGFAAAVRAIEAKNGIKGEA